MQSAVLHAGPSLERNQRHVINADRPAVYGRWPAQLDDNTSGLQGRTAAAG